MYEYEPCIDLLNILDLEPIENNVLLNPQVNQENIDYYDKELKTLDFLDLVLFFS